MKTLRIISVLCLGLFLVMAYGIAQAEDIDDIEPSVVSLTVPETCKLVIASGPVDEVLVADGSSETAFEAGELTCATQPVLTVDANKQWALSVAIGSWTIPAGYVGNKTSVTADSDIKLAVSDGGNRTGFASATLLTDSSAEIASYTGGVSDEAYTCTYTILLDWTADIPGDYEITATYTLATQA